MKVVGSEISDCAAVIELESTGLVAAAFGFAESGLFTIIPVIAKSAPAAVVLDLSRIARLSRIDQSDLVGVIGFTSLKKRRLILFGSEPRINSQVRRLVSAEIDMVADLRTAFALLSREQGAA